jgi:hypothetical protein
MPKILLTLIVLLCLFLTGCDRDEDACIMAAYKEYKQSNVVSLTNYRYLVYSEKSSKFYIIEKLNQTNSNTSSSFDVTDFINSKNEVK